MRFEAMIGVGLACLAALGVGDPQIGGKSTDLVMFIMNEPGINDRMAGHIKVGAECIGCRRPGGAGSRCFRRMESGDSLTRAARAP